MAAKKEKKGTSEGKKPKVSAPRKKKAAVIITVSPATVEASAPTVIARPGIVIRPSAAVGEVSAPPVSVISYIRKRAALMRSWPPDDPHRTTEKQVWRQMLTAELQAGDGGTAALTAVARGEMKPLSDFLAQSGPRGLAHVFHQSSLVDLTEAWWFDLLVDKESSGAAKLKLLLRVLLNSIPRNRRQYTDAEREARKKARRASDQRNFRKNHPQKKERP